MARPATGNIWLQGGKYHVRLRGVYYGAFPSRVLAERRLNAAKRSDEDKAPDTLAVFGPQWLDAREAEGIRSIKSERSAWNAHIATAPFYDAPMRSIRPRDIDAWVKALLRKQRQQVRRTKDGVKHVAGYGTLSRGSVRHARRVLLQCFTSAAIAGKVSSNPVREVQVPRKAVAVEDSDAWSWLTVDEMARLFAAFDRLEAKERAYATKYPDRKGRPGRARFYRAVYTTAIYSGLRASELFALRWEDVDLDGAKPMIRVRRSKTTRSGALKADSSRRDVPLLRQAREALLAWKKRDGVVRATGLVFPADGGGHFAQGYDCSWVQRWRREARVRDYVTFHDLRHTCGSHLVQGTWGETWTPLEVRDWLGHSDLKTTQRYAKLAPDSLHAKAQGMDGKAQSKRNGRK
jgi:integrase